MKKIFAICFIAISFIAVAVTEDCERCIEKEECPSFGKLSQDAQAAWQANYPCSGPKEKEQAKLFGFAATAKGDYVCCSNTLWGTTGSSSASGTGVDQTPTLNNRHADYNANYDPHNNYGDQNSAYNDYQKPRPPRYSNGYDNNRFNNGWGSNQYPNDRGYYNNENSNYPYNANRANPPKNYFNANNSPYVTRSPYFPGNNPGYNGHSNEGGQCPVTSFPPAPETGCCGLEATDPDRLIGHQPRRNAPASSPDNGYQSWPYGRRSYEPGFNRGKRSDDEVTVTIEDRIAGGRETDLYQFPWTVLLVVNFDYGNKRAAFNCGGSLISGRYVLSAGHCVYEEGAKVVDVDVYLAEYDKRTFPKDCKNVLGQGQKCIENVIIKSEEVILHPQYEDTQLKNDVSLIRLRTAAPYTEFIRPICLPSIDIDTPKFSNVRLAVAGWGRNGRYRSDIKQSTIVNLVPQEKCSESYPGLSRQNICAAGYTGQDTCKGDSGGPLMTMYGGKYQVVGVVSGKRADSPCGTSVPSLYTNVYHYLDWIRKTIKE